MTDHSTPDRIMDAAETLFAEKGFRGTSLRAITTTADVNLAAVNYHFGSKEALIRAVFERKVSPINRERLARLDKLETTGRGCDLDAVLDALYRPAVNRVMEHPEHMHCGPQLLARIHADRSDSLQATFTELFAEVARRFMLALEHCLPDLSAEERAWRFHFLIGIMVHAMTELGRQSRPHASPTGFHGELLRPASVDVFTSRLISFAAAGLRAPAPDTVEKTP